MSSEDSAKKENDYQLEIVDFDMPFLSMMSFIMKLAIAGLPALVLYAALAAALYSSFS